MASNSLFGGASTTPQSNSLFGANNSTASPFGTQAKPGLGGLGGAGTQGTQTSGLFGGSQPQAQQQGAQTSTLFGGQQPQAQQQGAQTPTPFGAQTQQQGAQASSLFGGQPQTQPQPPILGQTQQANNTQTQGQNASQPTQPAFFNSLLERGKKRPLSSINQNNNFEEMPSIQLGLDDIRRKARELGSSGQKDTPNGKSSKA
jgi:nuclear pore complex protein Nup93